MPAIYAPTLTTRVIMTAAASQSFKLTSLDGTYNVFFDDVSVATDATLEQIFALFITTENVLPSFVDLGFFTSYRPATSILRLERTDGGEITCDPAVNSTSRVVGNTLTVTLAGGTWTGGALETEAAVVSPEDPQGFFTISNDPSVCSDYASAQQQRLQPATPLAISYKYAAMPNSCSHRVDIASTGTLDFRHIGGSGILIITNRGEGEAGNPSNLVAIPVPPSPMEVFIQFDFDTMMGEVSYTGYAQSFAIKPSIVPEAFGAFGVLLGVKTAATPNSCSAVPMEIKFWPASAPDEA